MILILQKSNVHKVNLLFTFVKDVFLKSTLHSS